MTTPPLVTLEEVERLRDENKQAREDYKTFESEYDKIVELVDTRGMKHHSPLWWCVQTLLEEAEAKLATTKETIKSMRETMDRLRERLDEANAALTVRQAPEAEFASWREFVDVAVAHSSRGWQRLTTVTIERDDAREELARLRLLLEQARSYCDNETLQGGRLVAEINAALAAKGTS